MKELKKGKKQEQVDEEFDFSSLVKDDKPLKASKQEKQRKSKNKNKIDKFEEDYSTLQRNTAEDDIHLNLMSKGEQDNQKIKRQQLDFDDIFDNILKSKDNAPEKQNESSDLVNTTKLKKQLKTMDKTTTKVLQKPLSGIKKLKAMRE